MAGLERAQNDFGPADNVLGTPSYQSSTVDHYSRQEANQSARFSPADEKQAQLQLGVDDFPDGGLQAWLVVVGTTCGTFSTFGFIASWGVFQAYYEEVLMPTRSASDIAWIGSLQYSLCFMPGILTGRMFDLGYFKIPYLLCTVVLVTSVILVAECKEYWQFVLCQGLAFGLACGGIYGPTMGCLGHFFKKKRGLALGFAAVGSGIGGVIFPIIARQLIDRVG
jgi:MCP family monocarboxylic acid transporter-like MFS transporter 10